MIAVTFRGAVPGVVTNGGWTFGSPVLRRDRKLAAAGGSPDLPGEGSGRSPPDRRLYVFVKPFAVSQIRRRPAGCSIL